MKFWKLHGIGNDFVAIDGRFDNKDASDYSEYAKAVCHRKFSVGADGLLVVKNSDNCDVEMVYYNADGSFFQEPKFERSFYYACKKCN